MNSWRRAVVNALALPVALLLLPCAVAAVAPPAQAQTAQDGLPPLPADKSVRRSAVIGGRKIDYVATIGSITLHDAQGKATGDIVFIAYSRPGFAPATRPVTFSFNGGPGASQIALNLGAIGPRRVDGGVQGTAPSDAPIARDNANSWLDFTDLVFIDPVGTGYSRSHLDEDGTKQAFFTPDSDIQYLSEVIYQWLRSNGRMTSPKYLIGESYGGYRVPRLAERLQTQLGVGVSGMILVSPALAVRAITDQISFSPLPDMLYLPTQAAAHLEAQGAIPTEALLAPVEHYARTEFVADILAGPADAAATARLVARVSELTGFDPDYVRRMNGRVGPTFLREARRKAGLVASGYDINVTTYDPFPADAQGDSDDPLLATAAARDEAMAEFLDRDLGWKVDGRYMASNLKVGREFDISQGLDQAVIDLRKAVANDPHLKVLISHGWNDIACPYFGSRLLIDQMPSPGIRDRVVLKVYPGGHMFYDRAASAAAWRRDAMALYAR
jgi:carboxypeptidase C (cathepsin A)